MLSAREVIKAACLAPAGGIPLDTVREIIDQQGLQVNAMVLASRCRALTVFRAGPPAHPPEQGRHANHCRGLWIIA